MSTAPLPPPPQFRRVAPKVGQVALWRYSGFPYVLGGHVTKVDAQGRVETREYGFGYYFTPVKVLPAEEGEAVLANLKALDRKHAEAVKIFNVQWAARARAAGGVDL